MKRKPVTPNIAIYVSMNTPEVGLGIADRVMILFLPSSNQKQEMPFAMINDTTGSKSGC